MPDLTHIPLKLTYRTGRDDLVHDFFVPCLETAVLYRRAAGYFTSAGLAFAARGVASLAVRRGRMRLVVSPHLEPDDCAALERAQENPAAVLRSIAARSLAEIEDALIKDRLNALAWLAAAGLLEIKLAMRVNHQGGYARGLFHAKTGVFSDDSGNREQSPPDILSVDRVRRALSSLRFRPASWRVVTRRSAAHPRNSPDIADHRVVIGDNRPTVGAPTVIQPLIPH
ncbi:MULTISPECIES: hypothetical protein [unclassified Thiocapsa]|uniref:hypothetical protein n=1 Tax=unclassified Thiocapsa TaxID=2641286 RepID=UPI0035AE6B29